jgi:hypothetical protein
MRGQPPSSKLLVNASGYAPAKSANYRKERQMTITHTFLRGEDSVDQLPSFIEAGPIAFTLWSTFGDGEPVADDIFFRWDGRRAAQWRQDISPATWPPSFHQESSSPITGTAAWPNGKDVELTYHWGEIGKEGKGVLVGAAPTSDHPDSDQGARDPQRWIRLGQVLLDFLYEEVWY